MCSVGAAALALNSWRSDLAAFTEVGVEVGEGPAPETLTGVRRAAVQANVRGLTHW